MTYDTFPNKATISLEPFTINTPKAELDDLKALLKLTRVPKSTFENTQTKPHFGVSRDWVIEARKTWTEEFDWQKQVDRINAISQWIATVKNHDGLEYKIHLLGLISKKKDAVPVILSHGWPGSFLEFLPMFELVKQKWSEDDLPFHFIVPSLPGWAYSSPPPLDREFSVKDTAYLFNELMLGLGFESYAAQGGDIGSMVSQELAAQHDACKVVHLNFKVMSDPEAKAPPSPTQFLDSFQMYGYALEQATKPATIGMVVGCNPLSLLCWTGEKYMAGRPYGPELLEEILTFVTLYWLTDTYPSSIYYYRYAMGGLRGKGGGDYPWISKPLGYSKYPKEINKVKPEWVATTGNLVWSKVHEAGGHFAALERPADMLSDIEDFIKVAWGQPEKARL